MKIIEVNNLTKKYNKTIALDNLNLVMEEGSILGYLGPNGSGKTTTIKLLLGLIKPTKGSAKIFGLDSEKDKIEIHKNVAYVPSEPALWPNLTGKETLYMFSKLHEKYNYDEEKRLIKLFDFDVNKKIREYSRGNRQKIALIYAFSTKAKLLIMDEPSNGLDPLVDKAFRDTLISYKKNGGSVFLSSHLLEEVEAVCDDIAILKKGNVVESGSLSELKHLAATNIQAYFNKDIPSLEKFSNLKIISKNRNTIDIQVNGSVNEVLDYLLKFNPDHIYSTAASLEDLFMSFYKDN